MSFDIWVERGIEPDVETLFHEPLGAERTVVRWWNAPAKELGLPHLAALDGTGDWRVANEQLDELETELGALEQAWADDALIDQQPPITNNMGHPQPLRQHLQQRLRVMRQAVEVARAEGGWLYA